MRMDQGSTRQQSPTQTTALELSASWQSSKLELEAHGPAQRHSQQWRQQARQRSLTRTGTADHWSAQRHPCGGDNRPDRARLQHAELGSTATTQGLRDSDARPAAPASAAPQPTSTGPAQRRSVTFHCGGDNQPDRDHQQAQCFTGLPSDTPAVETTCQAEHACSTQSSRARQQPKDYATRMHAPAAQPTSTGPAQRRSVTFHCGGDNLPSRQ